jgi:hypothetical protein
VAPPVGVLHVDVDQFLVALARRGDPSLVGRAVIVGGTGDPMVPRTVCTCASYEARRIRPATTDPAAVEGAALVALGRFEIRRPVRLLGVRVVFG